MQSPKYSVVIPTYNNCEKYLKPCIDSIIKYTEMTDIELVISANGCTDNTKAYLQYLKTVVPNMQWWWNDEPLGFAKATNVGIKAAKTNKIVLLNNDTLLLEQPKNKWLERLDTGDISAVLTQYSAITKRRFGIFFCVMINKKVFDTIGLLNEDYGTGGCEDTEFCIEAEKAGFKLIDVGYQGDFPIFHVAEGTVHDPELVQNWDQTFNKNLLKLAQKYSDKDIKDSLAWMCDNGTEATELYDEVVTGNTYGVSSYILKDREVLDIGANMGTFSIFASKLGASKVISVEPVSATMEVFKSNIIKAGVDNIVLKQNIVSDKSGNTIKMALHDKSGHNSMYIESELYEEVQTITIKDLLDLTVTNNIFLKIDCEGGEYDILLNADPADMAKITIVAIEIHGDLHPVYKDISIIRQKLFEFGYRVVEQHQIGAWDGIDQFGNKINYRDLPLTQELWKR